MVQYTKLCKQPSKPIIKISPHLIDDNFIHSYSLNDLCDIAKLQQELESLHSQLLVHITENCEVLYLRLHRG